MSERVLLDANVLFPSILREILLGTARRGGFVPLWSPRILEEWARATRRLPEGAETIARGEIALMRAEWPEAEVTPPDALTRGLDLPDPEDQHVLAAAIAGEAAALMTLNRVDFPTRILGRHGILLREPDGYLVELFHAGFDMGAVVAEVHARVERLAGEPRAIRSMLKRAGLPRLGKLLQ